ncbi:hypothetical protein [Saccharothrix xinjiangensis]|uniref:hypothetical protein n=1 Tax=Saccharothrix xinjiangensis TaxID=204798 RepID=UPI0031CDEB5B
MTFGPPDGAAPGPVPGAPGTFWASQFGSIFLNWSRLNWSLLTCVWAVALMPCCTFPMALAALLACCTDASLELFSAGTATMPIGPSAFGPSFSPCNPLEIAASRDWRSPALFWRPCMDDSLMPNPELPVGPPTEGGGGDGGGVDVEGLPPGFTSAPPRAMRVLRNSGLRR